MLNEQDIQEIMLKTGKDRGQIEIRLSKADYLPEGVKDDLQIRRRKPNKPTVKRGIKKPIFRKSNSR